jgi:hypothetical protein
MMKAKTEDVYLLGSFRQELKEWTELMLGLSTPEQRAQLASMGVATARGIVAAHQAAHLALAQHNSQLKVCGRLWQQPGVLWLPIRPHTLP